MKLSKKNKKKSADKRKWKYNIPKSMGCSKNNSKREAQSIKFLSQKTRNISNKQYNFIPKGTAKRRTNKSKRLLEARNNKDQIRNK